MNKATILQRVHAIFDKYKDEPKVTATLEAIESDPEFKQLFDDLKVHDCVLYIKLHTVETYAICAMALVKEQNRRFSKPEFIWLEDPKQTNADDDYNRAMSVIGS